VVRGRRRAFALVWLLLFFLHRHPAAAAVDTPSFEAVDDVVREELASGEIPGAVVLVGRGNRILYQRAYGSRALVPEPTPMTTDTIFDIASLTKPFGTTLAVLSLVEHGAVKLDASLGHYLREFRRPAFA
jgi:CubicO group peptidase (beta-lactamase class C family)